MLFLMLLLLVMLWVLLHRSEQLMRQDSASLAAASVPSAYYAVVAEAPSAYFAASACVLLATLVKLLAPAAGEAPTVVGTAVVTPEYLFDAAVVIGKSAAAAETHSVQVFRIAIAVSASYITAVVAVPDATPAAIPATAAVDGAAHRSLAADTGIGDESVVKGCSPDD
jgi:hypothetical protein